MMSRTVFHLSGILFLFLLIPFSTIGQQTPKAFQGQVVDAETRKPLVGAVCQLLNASGKPISFAMSKADGSFLLANKAGGKSLTVSLMGYKKQRHDPNKLESPIVFALRSEDIKLEEVIVRAEPVRKLGDTITYSASAFAGREDRYLADLLRKLPGIEVSESGLIRYEGEPISHMYIEGVDMLENRYHVATRNMPQEAVGSVQVLERHQHVKTLQDVVPERRAALNIKLKHHYKVRPFGEVVAGGGISDLWMGKLFGMQIGRKMQTMLSVKGNNTGTSLSGESAPLLDIEAMMNNARDREEVLYHAGFQSLQMKQNRYLMNRSGIGSLSAVVPLKQDLLLRGNVSFLADRTEQTIVTDQTYNLGTPQEIAVWENRYTKNKSRNALASFTLENNSSGFYLRNGLKMTLNSGREHVDLTTNTADYRQKGKSLPFIVQNDLSTVIKSDKHVYHLSSFVKYMDRGEDMLLNEELSDMTEMNPDVHTRDFVTNNSLESNYSLGRIMLNSKTTLGYRTSSLDYRSTLPMPLIQGMEGVYHYRVGEWSLGESPAFRYSRGRNYFSLSLPVVWHHFTLRDGDWADKRANRITFSPSFYTSWNVTPDWNLKASLAHLHAYGGLESFRSGYTRRDYRTFFLPSGFMQENYFSQADFTVNYSDILHMFYFRFKAGYSFNRSNEINSFHYSSAQSIIQSERYWHNLQGLSAEMRLSKYFFAVKANGVLEVRYNRMESLFKQADQLFRGRGNSLTSNLTLSKRFGETVSFTYALSSNFSWMESGVNAHRWMPRYQHTAELNITPTPKLAMKLGAEYSSTTLDTDYVHEDFFFDCQASYRIGRRSELNLSVHNLFDRRLYVLRRLTEFNTHSTMVPIRGRELLATIKFSY